MSEASDKTDEVPEKKTEDDLPQHILEKYDSDHQVQLIKGYRILQVLLYYPRNKLFFEKPENEILGTKCYYDVIEDPMWLYEIKKKFFSAEYNSLTEVIQDMRLIFENCYYFWGPKAAISEQCIQMERLLESQLMLLPKDLKCMCTLEKTHGVFDDEVIARIWNRCKSRVKNCSNLMLRTWRRRRMNEDEVSKSKSKLSNFCKNSRQIIQWEQEKLLLPRTYTSICSTPELPEIGLFLQLVQNLLGLKPISQYEIECMLLMPQHSSSFRVIMAALLNIERSETLPNYEDIITELERRLSDWYTKFENDSEERFEELRSLGVEPSFFESVGDTNPLAAGKFEELSYHQKVTILKALCDNLMRVRSDIDELVITKNNQEPSVQRVGRDRHGFVYIHCPTFLDFRLYKLKIQDDEDTNKNTPDDSVESVLLSCIPKNATDFELVADSIEKMRSLIDKLWFADLETSKKDAKGANTELIQALLDLDAKVSSKEADFIQVTNEVRVKLFNEWRMSCGSDEPVIEDPAEEEDEQLDDDENYDEGSEREASDDEDWNQEAAEIEEERNQRSDNVVSDEKEAEDRFSEDASDEERVRRRKKKKKKKKKSRKRKAKADAKQLNESFTEELHDVVKTEPLEKADETLEDFAAYYAKTEIKEEESNDGSVVNNRRRRSSVPSYSVYNENLFSDDSESASPEEIYSSQEDSDDEWEIPRKRSRNRNKNKVSRQFKASLVQHGGRRRGRHRKIDSETIVKTEENANPAAALVAVKEEAEAEIAIKEEVKIEPDDSASEKTADAGEEAPPKEDGKPPVKIKVIDFAKLKNSSPETSAPTPVNPGVNAFVVQQVASVNALPVIRAAFSKVQPSMMARQPMMNSAYLMSSNQSALRTPNPNLMPRYPGAPPNMNAARIPRIVRAQSMNPAYQPQMFKRMPAMKQVIRGAPLNVPNKFYANEAMMRKQPMTYERVVRTTAPMPKIGRNITVVPKTIQRRPSVREIEGTIGIHSDGGHMQYVVNLANGSHVPLSNDQVQKLREGNNGVLPQKLKIPVPADVAEKIEPCVVIDD